MQISGQNVDNMNKYAENMTKKDKALSSSAAGASPGSKNSRFWLIYWYNYLGLSLTPLRTDLKRLQAGSFWHYHALQYR